MHYRYPPVTYFLLWPLGRLPLYWSGAIWMTGAWAAFAASIAVAVRSARMRISGGALAVGTAYMLAYVVLAIRSGNIQPYVIAMILAALFIAESHCAITASLMAVAITFKIWPAFFLPWFLRRRRRAVLLWLVPILLALWLVPLVWWSPSRYLDLLCQWFRSEFHTATSASEIWHFPGQSLRGVLLRYLTASDAWLKEFPDIHIAALPPHAVVDVWLVTSAVFYTGACVAMLRSSENERWVWDGASFAIFTLLEPFCPKSSMISMVPAVLVATALHSRPSCGTRSTRERLARRLFVTASALSLVSAVTQVKPLLRLLLVLGADFFAASALLVALLLRATQPKANAGPST